MTGLTIRQIFKEVKGINNLGEVISSKYKEMKLRISINGHVIYDGDSYIDFYNAVKKELPEEAVKDLLNTFWCGGDTQTISYLFNVKIESYIRGL